jgi:hypothetical protein
MLPRNFSNGKERSSGASLFLRLAQSASIEEVLEDLRKIAAEKGIHLSYSAGRFGGSLSLSGNNGLSALSPDSGGSNFSFLKIALTVR